MLTEVQLRFRREGAWLQETSERHPSSTFVVSSLYEAGDDVHLSLLVVELDANILRRMVHEWGRDPRIKQMVGPYQAPGGAGFQFTYSKEFSTYPILASHNPFSFRFSAVAQGNQYLSIVGESVEVERLLQDLGRAGTVDILSVKKVAGEAAFEAPRSFGKAFEGLSENQLKAIVLAYDRHYYTWPRRVTATDLAKEVGLSTPSFLHHLRQAEDRLISALLDELHRLEPSRIQTARSLASGSWGRAGHHPSNQKRSRSAHVPRHT